MVFRIGNAVVLSCCVRWGRTAPAQATNATVRARPILYRHFFENYIDNMAQDNDLRTGDTPLHLAGRVLRSRWHAFTERFNRDFMRRTLRIGVSARIYHPEPGATGLRSKNLQYLEESIAQWVMPQDVLVFMVPTVNTSGLLHPSNITMRHYACHLDGLVLQGGADVSPMTYSAIPAQPEWGGGRARRLRTGTRL
jgi:hypothetical protein